MTLAVVGNAASGKTLFACGASMSLQVRYFTGDEIEWYAANKPAVLKAGVFDINRIGELEMLTHYTHNLKVVRLQCSRAAYKHRQPWSPESYYADSVKMWRCVPADLVIGTSRRSPRETLHYYLERFGQGG